jgi:hypothetical protein
MAVVSDQQPLRVAVTFDDADGPITGELETDGSRARFHGWIGLAAALDSAHQAWRGSVRQKTRQRPGGFHEQGL